MFRKKGFSVFGGKRRVTALNLFRANLSLIELIPLDVTGPGMPGHDALSEFRRIRPDVKVIPTSG